MPDIVKVDLDGWYESLVVDCRAIIAERLYRSRQEIIEGWHEVGERICTDQNYQKYAKGNLAIHRRLAEDIGKSLTTLYYAIQFYDKYPVLSNALETFDKNISWFKITNAYLAPPKAEHRERKELDLEPYHVLFRAIKQTYFATHDRPAWLEHMARALDQMDSKPSEGCINFISALRELISTLESMLY